MVGEDKPEFENRFARQKTTGKIEGIFLLNYQILHEVICENQEYLIINKNFCYAPPGNLGHILSVTLGLSSLYRLHRLSNFDETSHRCSDQIYMYL